MHSLIAAIWQAFDPPMTVTALIALYVDQLMFLTRAGFDAVLPETPIDPAVAERTLARFPNVYMKAADSLQPIWALREQSNA